MHFCIFIHYIFTLIRIEAGTITVVAEIVTTNVTNDP